MVRVIGFSQRLNDKGEPFNVLHLQGDIEIVQSSESGKHYATARETSIPSTFDEVVCQDLIGKKLKGTIERVPCDEYAYEIEETGETIMLEHTWEYNPEPSNVEEHVFEGQQNGVTV